MGLVQVWKEWKCRNGWSKCGTCPSCCHARNGTAPGQGIRQVGAQIRERSERRQQKIDGALDRFDEAQKRQGTASVILQKTALDGTAKGDPATKPHPEPAR